MKIFKLVLVFALFCQSALMFGQAPNWTINPSSYQYSMTVTGLTYIDCQLDTNSNNMVGAFINGTLAGYAPFDQVINGDRFAYLTIFSNNAGGEDVTFKLYDESNDVLVDAVYGVEFQENATSGDPTNPYEFKTDFGLESIELDNDTIFEFFIAGDTVGRITLLDEEGIVVQGNYTFVNDTNGIDNDAFEFDGNTLVMAEDVDFVNHESYSIHILATATGGCGIELIKIITVINSNVPPTDIIENPAYINENEVVGSLVGILEAIDASPNDSHVFELVGDSATWLDNFYFEIDGNELLSGIPFNYEDKDEFVLQIKVTDNLQNSFIDTFSVFIEDLIEFDDLKANNVITPNGDGVNDFFQVPNVELFANFELQIFNENGNQIFRRSPSAGYNNLWDGLTTEGKELPSGTYYYWLKELNSEEEFTGIITLLRD